MNKYLITISNTWNEILTYRLSFVMWRIRNVFQLLTIYFLWFSLIPGNQQLFGYSQSLMLTYVIGTSLLSAIVLSTRTHEIGENINSGSLSSFLIKPINYFGYWFARDIGDKLINITFAIVELTIVFFIFQPPLFIQLNVITLSLFAITIFMAVLLYFFIGSLLGMIGFWSPEVWAPRFIFFILISFFAGALFPLDVFPKYAYAVFKLLPFPYLLYFPLKVYLGQISVFETMQGILITVFWILFFWFLCSRVWKKGLKAYTAYGN